MDFMQRQQRPDQLQAQPQIQEQMQQNAPQQIQQQGQEQMQEGQEQMQQQVQQLNQHAQMNFPPAHAHAVADGRAVQQVIPARETYKARRAERRRVIEARKAAARGEKNIVARGIKHSLEDYNKQLTNSYESYFLSKEADQPENREMDLTKNRSGVDMQVLRYFSHGFQKDSEGNPATDNDLKYQLEDAAFYDAFCSTDYIRRAPYLQRMVEEVLSYNLKEDMFSDISFEWHAADLKSITSRMAYMEKVMNDGNNAYFFDELLSSEKKKALKGALEIFNLTSSLFTAECQKRGVEPNEEEVHYIGKKDIAAYSKREKEYREQFQKALKEYKYDKYSRIRREAEMPDSKVYQQIRSLLNDDVQKILDCDVQKLFDYDLEKPWTLSDEKLREKREELNKLYTVSLNVEKCLTLRSPDQFKWYSNGTLREDLIGQRKLEYEYKSELIRLLAERAAGLEGSGNLTRLARLYKEQMTPTRARQEFLRDVIKMHKPDFQGGIVNDSRFVDVVKEFYARRKDLAESAVKDRERRNSVKYRPSQPLEWDSEPPETIGETLFRNLVSFLNVEATQTLLTPEQFEQMLLNLEATDWIKGQSGQRTLKKVIDARYEMLERKYGSSIENLTVQDVMEHFVDMGKDFANIQIDLYMLEHFPDFIREEDSSDERLAKRIRYYNAYAPYIFHMIESFSKDTLSQKPSSDDTFKLINPEEVVDMYDREGRKRLGAVRDALMENNGFLKNRPDWSQKVKKPADTK